MFHFRLLSKQPDYAEYYSCCKQFTSSQMLLRYHVKK